MCLCVQVYRIWIFLHAATELMCLCWVQSSRWSAIAWRPFPICSLSLPLGLFNIWTVACSFASTLVMIFSHVMSCDAPYSFKKRKHTQTHEHRGVVKHQTRVSWFFTVTSSWVNELWVLFMLNDTHEPRRYKIQNSDSLIRLATTATISMQSSEKCDYSVTIKSLFKCFLFICYEDRPNLNFTKH